jgi:hypothetical protein
MTSNSKDELKLLVIDAISKQIISSASADSNTPSNILAIASALGSGHVSCFVFHVLWEPFIYRNT